MAPAADQYASLDDMQAWAHGVMLSRQPDQIINAGYLRRWYLTPRSPHLNTYLHEIIGSDDDRALHDHPWNNTSLLISGSYREHTPHGVYIRRPGDFVTRVAIDLHRLELVNDEPVISLFTTGPKVREWGFAALQGWVHWRKYHAAEASRPMDVGVAA